MKKLYFLAVAALLPFGATAGTLADNGFYFKPYVGADYEYTSLNYNNVAGTTVSYGDIFADSLNGGDVHIGARVHKYLGFEAAYADTASEGKSGILGTTVSSSVRLQEERFDAMGYLPLGESKVELIGLVGIEHASGNSSITVGATTYSGDSDKTFAEFGGGAQYWFNDNLDARLLVRYDDVNSTAISSGVVTSIGLNWQF